MSWLERGGGRLAWCSLALAVLMAAAAFAIGLSTPDASRPAADRDAGFDAVFALVFLAFSTVGALVAARRPENAIGWLFVALGLVGVSIGLSGEWATNSLYAEGSALPAGTAVAWLAAVLSAPLIPALILILLVFPDGRPLTPRWRVVAWLTGAAGALLFVGKGLGPGPLDNVESVRNPLALAEGERVLEAVELLGTVGALALLIAAAASLVLRFRTSRGLERQQIKWFAAGAAFAAVLFGGVLATSLSEPLRDSESVTRVSDVLVALAFTALPLSAGVAVLRHRLWDIDVVINRTLVYGALSATLGGAYVLAVLLLQLILNPLTEQSELAVAASTLAVATLFRPARSRIQEAVDRRFYRHKYDARRTLDAFSARLRDELDLDALGDELRAVVSQTMQPSHVSLWLRKPAG